MNWNLGRAAKLAAGGALMLVLAVGALGCASVKPYEKEHLADPIMVPAVEIEDDMRELKWLESREGSTGGAGGAGGGCACK